MVTIKRAKEILKTYGEAWTRQDTAKILGIFTDDATYHEPILGKPFKGRKGIAGYWRTKVCDDQSNIKFRLLNFYVCEDTVIAEWEAFFDSAAENARMHMKEVAILEIKDDKIKSLREYWHAEKVSRES